MPPRSLKQPKSVFVAMPTLLGIAALLVQPQDSAAFHIAKGSFAHTQTSEADVSATAEGALIQFYTAPKWRRESDIAGVARWECGHSLVSNLLRLCTKETVDIFRSYTHILRDNLGSLSQVTNNVFLLAESGGAQACIRSNSAFGNATPTIHNPLRVIVDAQYINRPRCCHGNEVEGLVLNAKGENYEWTDLALRELDNVTENGLSFYMAKPKEEPCTAEDQCPLVIQIAGAAGNPWFLIQNHCSACQKQLGAVIIAPILEKDVFLDDGGVAGSSNQVLETTLIPFLDSWLPAHAEIDPERVYVVAQSQGDDTALRLALLRPDLISLVSLSGKNAITNETKEMLRSPNFVLELQGRLRYIQWNIGDMDTTFEDEEYFATLAQQLRLFSPGLPRLDLRIYPQSFHSVWWAAWNSLHEVIWTGQRSAAEAAAGITTTCRGAESLTTLG